MKLMIASFLALGLAQAVHASPATTAKKYSTVMQMATQTLTTAHTSKASQIAPEKLACDQKGEACYPDSNYFCCSGLCVDMMCD